MFYSYSMNYKEALKEGFYELQSARDWYREMTTTPLDPSSPNKVIGMHASLVESYMKTTALLIQPIAPHFAEHMYEILGIKESVQKALWTDIPVLKSEEEEKGVFEAGLYMRATAKSVRDAEITLQKKAKKGAAAGLAGGKKAVKLIVATEFPAWQDGCVEIVKELVGGESGKVELDDSKVKSALASKGLLKDKRVMPFVQVLKVSLFSFFFSFQFLRGGTLLRNFVLRPLSLRPLDGSIRFDAWIGVLT